MDLFAARVECLPGERHEVLPADQPTHTSAVQFDRREGASVALAPHGPLFVGRHQLALAQHQLATGIQYQEGVVERSTAIGALPFGDTNRYRYASSPRGLRQSSRDGARHFNCIGIEPAERVDL